MLRRAQLYFHTVRHLHLHQITDRLTRKMMRPRIGQLGAPPVAARCYVRGLEKASSMEGPATFNFLNRVHTIPDGWNSSSLDPLWVFNLHYFDDLNAADSGLRQVEHRMLIARWIRENPIGVGYGWEAYTISLRAVNWIKWHWRTDGLDSEMLASLAQQARYLRASLETHLGGNHLWANAIALIWLGVFFTGPEADDWLGTGRDLLAREMSRQILADGAHYERSTMYHALLTANVLELIELSRQNSRLTGLEEALKPTAAAMLGWMMAMSHGDGQIAFFNDAAFDIAPSPTQLTDYASSLSLAWSAPREGLSLFAESGFARLQIGALLVLADVGSLGPDELLGHAHAETLSFELSHGASRVMVNSGTSTYWDQSLRDWQRSTSSHNTVCIDGADSSEVWSRFRVARRARARVLDRLIDGSLTVAASHDGYRRLPGSPVHTRTWQMHAGGLRIRDEISGTFSNASAFVYLHPMVQATPQSRSEVSLAWPGTKARVTTTSGCELMKARYFPQFGVEVANSALKIPIAASSEMTFTVT